MKPLFVFPFVVALIVVLVSCAVKRSDTPDAADLTFESFFEDFARDSVFQINRISFPVKYSFLRNESDDLTSKLINKDGWRFINFGKDSLARDQTVDAFDVKITKKDSLNVEYERVGIDNGISIIYFFSKHGNKWYLVSVLNQSV